MRTTSIRWSSKRGLYFRGWATTSPFESEQVGPSRGRVVASEGRRKLRAMVRKDRGRDLISITELSPSADSEVRRQVLELAQSIRAIKSPPQ